MKCFLILFIVSGAYKGVIGQDNCNVVPMREWAGEETLRKEVLPSPVRLVVIQHTVTPDVRCEDIARAIRKYHMRVLQFDDIAQSFLVCADGKVYEGAGWSHVGAHTKNYNIKAIGVSFIGDFSSALPSEEALKAAQSLLTCGVKNGHLSGDFKVIGHRQVSNTQSPGEELQKEIEKWPQWTNQVV